LASQKPTETALLPSKAMWNRTFIIFTTFSGGVLYPGHYQQAISHPGTEHIQGPDREHLPFTAWWGLKPWLTSAVVTSQEEVSKPGTRSHKAF